MLKKQTTRSYIYILCCLTLLSPKLYAAQAASSPGMAKAAMQAASALLFAAVQQGDVGKVDTLIEEGANPWLPDCEGLTLIDFAVPGSSMERYLGGIPAKEAWIAPLGKKDPSAYQDHRGILPSNESSLTPQTVRLPCLRGYVRGEIKADLRDSEVEASRKELQQREDRFMETIRDGEGGHLTRLFFFILLLVGLK